MQDDLAAKREQAAQIVRREMERKSHDLIRVYNPLDEPFRYMYDSRWHSVPAHGTKDIERFLARKYFDKISQFMIGQQILVKGKELIERRRKQGLPEYLDKYVENEEVWKMTPRLNDPLLLEQIGEVVILGLVEEYGLDIPDLVEEYIAPSTDSPTDQVFKKFDRKIAPENTEEETA